MANENPIPDALAVIVKQLRDDKDYYRAWQSNIAMAFQDSVTLAGYRFPELHKLANEAADNFLNNLTRKSDAANVA
jgi:GH25 family lysozyme M1 (1,4-beta-N-acetylmuramidase)